MRSIKASNVLRALDSLLLGPRITAR